MQATLSQMLKSELNDKSGSSLLRSEKGDLPILILKAILLMGFQTEAIPIVLSALRPMNIALTLCWYRYYGDHFFCELCRSICIERLSDLWISLLRASHEGRWSGVMAWYNSADSLFMLLSCDY